ncbi:MAG TPA: DNA repair protein RecO [Patescibacteria group bacterium]|jgi:DNA repair protein RecO (recombination protein O)|nr:DNA repair protein RecO [Patescibacteria group bacterium]
MNYRKYTGIVLKKQNYKEADQIITVWTKQAGKIRVLGKSLRRSQSKLAYSLQDLSLVDIELVASKHLPTLVSAQCLKNFKNLREDLSKVGTAFYASELILKMTADEHPNHEAFSLLKEFLEYLNVPETKIEKFSPALEAFSLKLLSCLGFGKPKNSKSALQLNDYIEVLDNYSFGEAEKLNISQVQRRQLHTIISGFIESVLERHLKSELFLVSI